MSKNKTINTNDMNTKKRRVQIGSGFNKKTGKSIIEKRKYVLRLSKTEIAILTGALEYWMLDHNYGYSLWLIQDGSVGGTDYYYRSIVVGLPKSDGLWDVLKGLCKVKPNYGGYWGDIDRLAEMCKKKVDEYTKQAKEFEEEKEVKA